MSDGIPRIEIEHLINPRWIGVLVAVLLVSVLAHQAILFFAGAVLLLALGLSWLWGRHCLDGLTYRRSFSAPAVMFGDEVTLTLDIVNGKILPLPWIEMTDEVPEAIEPLRGEFLYSWKAGRRILPNLLALRWYERVVRRYRLRCTERGEHVFGPIEIRSGDLFGLATRRIDVPDRQTLLVYPKVVPIEALGLPSRFPLGDERSPNPLWQDPLRVSGIRPYVRGDSLRQMHWKATARTGELQVRTYDPSTTLEAMLFLNVATMARPWEGVRRDVVELAICAAASLASHLAQGRYRVGLAANGLLRGTGQRVYARPDRAPGHLTGVLALLARVNPMAIVSFVNLLWIERTRVPAGATVAIITGLYDDEIRVAAHAYRAGGHPVILLLIGDDLRDVREPGITTYWVGDEAHWRELATLRGTAPERIGEEEEAAACST